LQKRQSMKEKKRQTRQVSFGNDESRGVGNAENFVQRQV